MGTNKVILKRMREEKKMISLLFACDAMMQFVFIGSAADSAHTHTHQSIIKMKFP